MREIKNNTDISKAQIRDVKFSGSEKPESKIDTANVQGVEIKDFSNPQAEALGRSQVSSTDNVKNDVAFGMANPEAIESSDRYFEMAYNNLVAQGHPNAYEEAAAQSTAYGREFV